MPNQKKPFFRNPPCSKCIHKKVSWVEVNQFESMKENVCSNKKSERFGKTASRNYTCKLYEKLN